MILNGEDLRVSVGLPQVPCSHRRSSCPSNATLTERGRLKLAQCVVDDGWPLRRAAERFQVSAATAKRWADRYRQLGTAGMVDRSSRPHHSPRRTGAKIERKILHLRRSRGLGLAAIAGRLGMHPLHGAQGAGTPQHEVAPGLMETRFIAFRPGGPEACADRSRWLRTRLV